jgi:hypothetical protein
MSDGTAGVRMVDAVDRKSATPTDQDTAQQKPHSIQEKNGYPPVTLLPQHHDAGSQQQDSSSKNCQQPGYLLDDSSYHDDLDMINAADLNITEAISDRKRRRELKDARPASRVKLHAEAWKIGYKKMGVTGIEGMRILRARVQAGRVGITKERRTALSAGHVHVPIVKSSEANETANTPAIESSVNNNNTGSA